MRLRYSSRAHPRIYRPAQQERSNRRGTANPLNKRIASAISWPWPRNEYFWSSGIPDRTVPYLVYHQVRGDEVVIIHVRDGRRDAPRAGQF